jgi:hypothetical protein
LALDLPPSVFVEDMAPQRSAAATFLHYLTVLFLISILGGSIYVYLNPHLIDKIFFYLSGQSEVAIVKPALPPPVALPAKLKPPANPYWNLPNWLDENRMPMGRVWSREEEAKYKSALASPYTYQRYKLILDLRDERLRGSEGLLWAALSQKKFWTRMRALMALADFGYDVAFDVVEKAMEGASQDLRANFFKRFIASSTQGERYVMRQAIRLLDDRGRMAVLQAHGHDRTPLRDLYFVAAQYDPSPRVRSWLQWNMPELSFPTHSNYRKVIFGLESWEAFLKPPAKPKAKKQTPELNDQNLSQIN